MSKVINIFGGPGSGKSVLAAQLFSALKLKNITVDIAPEYAKIMFWENRQNILNDQIYLFAKQNRAVSRLLGKVEYIITDSPTLMGNVYIKDPVIRKPLTDLSLAVFNSYNSINIFLTRQHSYELVGRYQEEQEADIKADEIYNLLIDLNIPFINVKSDEINVDLLVNQILQHSN